MSRDQPVTRCKLNVVAPKTHRRREVVVPPFLHTMLAKHLARTDTELVWTNPSGTPLRSANFRRMVWIPALNEADIEYLRIHDLRHTAASLMISAGAHLRAVASQLGHSSIRVTMDVYGHLFPSDQDALAAAMEGLHRAAVSSDAPLTRPATVIPLDRS